LWSVSGGHPNVLRRDTNRPALIQEYNVNLMGVGFGFLRVGDGLCTALAQQT